VFGDAGVAAACRAHEGIMAMSEERAPRVSVVIPTYNRARTLSRAVGSVLSQDFRDIEVIIVDDGSTDATRDVVSSFGDERVRLISHDVNRGVGAARNTGIEAARGDLVAFQDSDDEWLQGKLSAQVRALEAAGEACLLVYCTKIVYGRDADHVRGPRRAVCVPGPEVSELSGDLREFLWRQHVISTQTMLVRTDALRRIGGFDTRLYNSEEWDIAIRLSEFGTFAFVDEPLVNNYIQKDSISTLTAKVPYSQLVISNKMKRRGVPASVQAAQLAWVGDLLGRLGRPRRGEVLIRASLAARPVNVKTWARFAVNRLRGLRRRA